MSYRPDKLRLSHFYRYVQRVFGFQDEIKKLNDFRVDERIKIESLFESLFLCLLLRLGSFRALEFEIKHGRAKKVMRMVDDFSINTLRYGLEYFELETLDEMLFSTCCKMKRSKMLSDTIDGLHVAAIDGTEYYRSEKIHCDDCMVVHLKDGTIQYVHRAVLMQHVGTKLKPFIAAEPVKPKDKQNGDAEAGHEGELTAAKRLVARTVEQYGKRFIDIFTTDALYMNEPFVRHCIKHGCHIVARVKDERTTLYKEIETLASMGEPIKGYDSEKGIVYTIYEIEEIHISLGWDIPLKGFKIIETSANGTQIFFCATTAVHIKADTIRRIVHIKWGIENNGIKDLKDNWFMEHNFHHHPVATWAILLTLLIAYNLFYAYVIRDMKTYCLYRLTIKQVVDEFKYSYFSLIYWLPWSLWINAP